MATKRSKAQQPREPKVAQPPGSRRCQIADRTLDTIQSTAVCDVVDVCTEIGNLYSADIRDPEQWREIAKRVQAHCTRAMALIGKLQHAAGVLQALSTLAPGADEIEQREPSEAANG